MIRTGAFLLAAALIAAVYLVPRFWPTQDAESSAAAAAARATLRATPAAGETPLYMPDANARRDLSLSYELKDSPKAPPQSPPKAP